MVDTIFLTGATGFLGTSILKNLIENTSSNVYVLVRAHSDAEARIRLTNLWWDIPVLRDTIDKRITLILGDITIPGLGLSKVNKIKIMDAVQYVIHGAAEVRLKATHEQLWEVNVEGTKNVLYLAKEINDHHGLKRFSHISTAYVAGLRKGKIMEDSLIHDEGFASSYEESKYEAEVLVRNFKDELSVSIFRPGQIIGDSKTGKISSFNTIYYPLKLFLAGKLKVLPMKKDQKMNIIPVDYVATAIVQLTKEKRTKGKTFHLTLPHQIQPTAHELILAVKHWAKENLNVQLNMPLFIPASFIAKVAVQWNAKQEKHSNKMRVVSNLLVLAPYFFENRIFETEHVEYFLGQYSLSWKNYIDPILSYATSKGFLNHNDRTVFEQIRFQLNRNTNPIQYFDVSKSRIQEVSGTTVNKTVEEVLSSLAAIGITQGDRVAITGINCIKHFIIDSAIGLLGAISVPIYYTTPPEEINLLLKKSGAKLFFIGDERILSKFEYIQSDIPIVAFTIKNDNASLFKKVSTWEKFLSQNSERITTHPICYSETATIRYTSGTTGEPKGVTFDHYQLRWMGETLASLLSWKTKNKVIRYLSFLPMSHVVEGILATYAPYYLPNKAKIYFLNEFSTLVDMLPKIRPTVFFSVPYFYEKVWNEFIQMKPAQLYLQMKEGITKQLFRVILKKMLLRKVGLDKCDQLICGSAPISNQLLQSFRDLGIEIHNAYGLTEAPLISLSKLFDNEIGSTGALLPETKIIIEKDGEILVKGPQVTHGYFGLNSESVFDNGYLRTGDFGHLSKNNKLVISGRKKEMLVTSNGKNINPQKIESMLKNNFGILEAMVIGDNLPYCTALLWLEESNSNPISIKTIDKDILKVNTRLSNPERIKKWVILVRPLSIAQGELTPNLKLRRKNITNNYQDVLKRLYTSEKWSDPKVIHMGGIE